MAAVTHPFVIAGMVSTAAALFIAAIAWYQRESPAAREYTVVMVVLAAWSTCYLLQLLQPTVAAKQPWLVARHALTPLIAVVFWVFAARYTDRPQFLSGRYLWPLVAGMVLVSALVVWNPHSVYWVALRPAMTASLPVVDISFGPAFWLNAGYTLGVVAAGHVFIVSMFRESLDAYRPQLAAMTVIGLIEFGLTLLFLSDHLAVLPSLNPWPHIQLITYGTTMAVIPIGWSYVNGALFKLQPLADQTVIENMDDAVFVFDRTDRLRYANSTAIQLLNPASETAVDGRSVETVFEGYPELLAQYRRTEAHTETEPETSAFTVDGETRYYHLRSSTISNSLGATTGGVVVARDVTKTTRQQSQLRERTEELEEKKSRLETQNRQLDQFSSFVSHDLRSPLQVARGYLRLVRDTEDLSHLEKVTESIRRMDEMVDDLRELTRVDQTELSTDSVEVETAARQAWAQVETEDASLTVGDTGEIIADREFLRHVFENLFRNSVEHGSTDSVEHGSTDNQPAAGDSIDRGGADLTVRVGTLPGGLYVEDDGVGIPEDERDDVLEHGYSTTTDGTGLGMSIVKTIVEVHGWAITVTESDDGGARFELTDVDRKIDTQTGSPRPAPE